MTHSSFFVGLYHCLCYVFSPFCCHSDHLEGDHKFRSKQVPWVIKEW